MITYKITNDKLFFNKVVDLDTYGLHMKEIIITDIILVSMAVVIIALPFILLEYRYRKNMKEIYKQYTKEARRLDKLYDKYKNEDV